MAYICGLILKNVATSCETTIVIFMTCFVVGSHTVKPTFDIHGSVHRSMTYLKYQQDAAL
jgi:hypothetical protein